MEPGRRAPEGFKTAIDVANKMDGDFVLTGGDMIADALGAGMRGVIRCIDYIRD